MATTTIEVTLFDDEGCEVERKLPANFVVCPSCDGKGTSVAHVECDGGGFTSEEWAEQDDDFKEGYLRGDYDRACPECEGRRVVAVVAVKECDPAMLKAYLAQIAECDECEAIHRMERRMGA